MRRNHLAIDAALGQIGRDGEGRDDQAVVLVRLPRHDPDRTRHRQADQGGHDLQHCLHPVAEPPPAQPGRLQLALLVQVLGLKVDQPGLFAQERRRVGVEDLAALRCPPERHGDRRRTGLIERLLRRGLGFVVALSHAAGCRASSSRIAGGPPPGC